MNIKHARSVSSFDTPTTDLFDSIVKFDFSADNKPNADILLPSLRQSGYTLETAIGDLVDNPLDAGADTIVISLDVNDKDWAVSVADNGSGMDWNTLDQMMRLGSRTNHDLETDLGAFGLGSTTASLSLGRRQYVLTRVMEGKLLSAATDLDEIIKSRQFGKHLSEANQMELELFCQTFLRWNLEVPITGTIVTISKCDKIERQRLPDAIKSIKKYIGETFRHFIWAGKKFLVNGEVVDAIDPLERNNPQTHILIEDTIDYTYPAGHKRSGEIEKIGVILIQLPDYGIERNKDLGYNQNNQGFYIMRNRREIVPHTMLKLDKLTKHPGLNLFRGEIFFPATMDIDLGVSFLKSSWDIKPTQSLKDKISQFIAPYARQARRSYNKSISYSDQQISSEEAVKVIKQRSAFLRKPQTIIEKREEKQNELNVEKTDSNSDRSREPRFPKIQKAGADLAVFEVKDLGLSSPFFEANLEGKKIVITYNGQHPFYNRFMLENRNNLSIINGIHYLVYSMASAELMSFDEDEAKFISTLRENYSFNLRQLLTT